MLTKKTDEITRKWQGSGGLFCISNVVWAESFRACQQSICPFFVPKKSGYISFERPVRRSFLHERPHKIYRQEERTRNTKRPKKRTPERWPLITCRMSGNGQKRNRRWLPLQVVVVNRIFAATKQELCVVQDWSHWMVDSRRWIIIGMAKECWMCKRSLGAWNRLVINSCFTDH